MADNHPAGNSEQRTPNPPPHTQERTAKSRSPVERAIVWGLIGILLIVLLAEARPWWALKRDRDALIRALRAAEAAEDTYVTESDVRELATRFSTHSTERELPPNEMAASRVDTFTYRGLIKNRIMYVYYGVPRPGREQEVLLVTDTKVKNYPIIDISELMKQDQTEATRVESGKQPPYAPGGDNAGAATDTDADAGEGPSTEPDQDEPR